ncbi:MAG: carbohydrate binding domain-containing protein [Patescibacteria group bacterium]
MSKSLTNPKQQQSPQSSERRLKSKATIISLASVARHGRRLVATLVMAMLVMSLLPLFAFEAHFVNVTAQLKPRCEQFEARSMGFWKNHPELRVFPQVIGDVTVTNDSEADTIFNADDSVMHNKLLKQLLALKFNLAYFEGLEYGDVPSEETSVLVLANEADALLLRLDPPVTNTELEDMKDRVELVNTAEYVVHCDKPLVLVNKVYYDVAGDTVYPNVLANPDFETGNVDPWVRTTTGSGTFTAGSPGYNGSGYAGRIGIATEGQVQMYQDNLTLQAGMRYRLSFAAKATSGHDLSVYLRRQSDSHNYGLNNVVFNLSSSWKTFSTQFVATGFSNTVTDARLRFYTAPYDANGDVYWFDNIVLERLPVGGRGADPANEWVELYNKTEVPLNISGWQICDAQACDSIPNNTPAVPSFGFAVVTGSATTWDYWYLPPEAVKIVLPDGTIGDGLDDDSDLVEVRRPDDIVVDQMNYSEPNPGWPNYNDELWNPGLIDIPEGQMFARQPTGLDTNHITDWASLAAPVVTLIYPDSSVAVWHWGQNFNIVWTAINPNGLDSDLVIDIFWWQDENQNHVLDDGDSVNQIAVDTENDGVYNYTVPAGFLGDVWLQLVATGPENFMAQGITLSHPIYDPPAWMIEQMPAEVLERISQLPVGSCDNSLEILEALSLDSEESYQVAEQTAAKVAAEQLAEELVEERVVDEMSVEIVETTTAPAEAEIIVEQALAEQQQVAVEGAVAIGEAMDMCRPPVVEEEPVVEQPIADGLSVEEVPLIEQPLADDQLDGETGELPPALEEPASTEEGAALAPVGDDAGQVQSNAEPIGGDLEINIEVVPEEPVEASPIDVPTESAPAIEPELIPNPNSPTVVDPVPEPELPPAIDYPTPTETPPAVE